MLPKSNGKGMPRTPMVEHAWVQASSEVLGTSLLSLLKPESESDKK